MTLSGTIVSAPIMVRQSRSPNDSFNRTLSRAEPGRATPSIIVAGDRPATEAGRSNLSGRRHVSCATDNSARSPREERAKLRRTDNTERVGERIQDRAWVWNAHTFDVS